MSCYIIPKHIEDRVTHGHRSGQHTTSIKDFCPKIQEVSRDLRSARKAIKSTGITKVPSSVTTKDSVFTAKKRRNLPGTLVAGNLNNATLSKDSDAIGAWTLADYFAKFCRTVLGRDSFDGNNGEIKSTIHYYVNYNNAFFNGAQMVYGDGDGISFENFAQDPSVVFHELWHGVTDRTCGLIYQDQSGALNESLSDIFASIIMQWMHGETVEEASWLIGERCVITINDIHYALRSLSDPGMAFVNHPYMGSDNQPQDMDHYYNEKEDDGGIHINSGIPNHAFYLFAKAVGGYSWNIPCAIWYKTIATSALISPNVSFAEFAQATITAATELYANTDPSIIDKLRKAWQAVKVL